MSSVVGREAEVAAVEAFLADGLSDRNVLAVVGVPGIGKTTVWDAAVAKAHARGSTVLVARPAEAEAKLSFAGLSDLLSHLSPDAFEALPPPQRDALDVALLRVPSGRAPERRLVGTALLSVLQVLAAETEVVVAIDDLQWLDPPSARAVEFALRRLANEPVRAILATRSHEAEPVLESIARERHLERLELGPLSTAALHRIIAEALGRTFPRPTLVRIAQVSDGNPLYALEIARLLDRSEERDPANLPVPESLNSLVAQRVRSLPTRTRDALLRAASLARPDLRLIDARALAAAEDAMLVRVDADGRIEFVHPLFASAVYSSASISRRRDTHRVLADAVDDPEERARHLALASQGPDEQVVQALEAAARRARMRGAPDTAAELIELALRLVPEGDPSVHELRLELAEHLYLASDFQRAGEVLENLRTALGPGDLLARTLLKLAEIEYWRSGESAAFARAEEALAAARDPVLRAGCHTAIAMYAGTVDLPKAAAAARDALALLEARPDADPGLVATALIARIRADLFLGDGFDAEAAERALALEAESPPAVVDTRVVFKLGQWLRYVDQLDAARSRLAEAEQQAGDEGDESSLANILLNRVVVETWAGDWGEATALTRRMSDAFEQLGVESEGIDPWRAYVDAHAGRLDAVRSTVGESRPREPIVAAIWSRCLGLAALAAGDTEAADRHLSDALADLDRVDFHEPAIWRVDGDAIEAAVANGDLNRARLRLAGFRKHAARSCIPWSLAVSARCHGIVLAADGELEAAADALDRALAEHARCPMPFERARTLLVHGRVLRRLKRKRQARESLEEAVEIFRRLDTEAWTRRAEDELARVAVRRAPEQLSSTELRIARLASSGLTNRAIATQVFLTPKAVEANLARAYRKLGIRSRAQLARALDTEDAIARRAN